MKINVLIYPCGTEIAFEIFNSLSNDKSISLYGANTIESHGSFLFKHIFTNAPMSGDKKLIQFLNKIINEYSIDFIYPAHDDALLYLTENRGNLNCEVISSDLDVVRTTRSKLLTYKKFQGKKFIPFFSANASDFLSYPFFAKPDIGQGSFGIQKIESKGDLNKLNKAHSYVYCEFLPGEEFTIDCFTDRYGNLLFCNCRTRERIRNGISVRSRTIPISNEIKAIADDINCKLNLRGAWFFQVKLDKNSHPKLLEIAPRIAGTMCVSRALGINLPLLTIYLFSGIDVKIIPNKYSILVDKCFFAKYQLSLSYKYVYVDFDDTFIINGKINTFLLMFLYQCINSNKKIILLTRHKKDIIKDLRKFRVSKDIFHKIITLSENEKKSNFIGNKSSIFIDDSFSERADVKLNCDINCFGTDMIDALIDWRK